MPPDKGCRMEYIMHKIGIISDTHGLLRDSVKENLKGCDYILHGGDIKSESSLKELNAIAKTYIVRGNVDKDWASVLPSTLKISLFGIKFFLIHNKKQITEDISDCNVIIYGHSHKYEQEQNNQQLWLNPGSCGLRRFTLPLTMALLHIKENGSFWVDRINLPTKTANFFLPNEQKDIKDIIIAVMKGTDKGKSVTEIARQNNINEELASQICRLYLTHPGVDADGILNKMSQPPV